jgi:hypothetical protein
LKNAIFSGNVMCRITDSCLRNSDAGLKKEEGRRKKEEVKN